MKIRNSHGQMTIEAILLVVTFLAIVTLVSSVFQKRKILQTLVGSPWDIVRGMVESGVWAPSKQASDLHPNYQRRHGTRQGDRN